MGERLRKRIFITIPLVAVGLIAVFAVVGTLSTRGLGGYTSAPETLGGPVTDVASTEKSLGASTNGTLARTAGSQTEESDGGDATSTIAVTAAVADAEARAQRAVVAASAGGRAHRRNRQHHSNDDQNGRLRDVELGRRRHAGTARRR